MRVSWLPGVIPHCWAPFLLCASVPGHLHCTPLPTSVHTQPLPGNSLLPIFKDSKKSIRERGDYRHHIPGFLMMCAPEVCAWAWVPQQARGDRRTWWSWFSLPTFVCSGSQTRSAGLQGKPFYLPDRFTHPFPVFNFFHYYCECVCAFVCACCERDMFHGEHVEFRGQRGGAGRLLP